MSNLILFDINDIITFGKHQGKTVKQIAIEDPAYINWMMRNLPTFFIKPVDMLNLMLVNNELELSEEQLRHYYSKKALCDFEHFLNMPRMDEKLWNDIQVTLKNKKVEAKHLEYIFEFVPMHVKLAVPEAYSETSWKFCQLGVADDACPLIRVFCDVTDQINSKSSSEAAQVIRMGLLGDRWHSHFYFEVSMESPLFAAVAQRLLKLKLIRLKKKKLDN